MQFFKPWYSACEKLIVENHVGHRCRNFEKEFWKIEHVRLFLVKHNSIFGTGYYNKKIQHFSSYRHFIYNIFYKNPEEKKLLNNLAKYLFITSQEKPAQSQKNNIRAKGMTCQSYPFDACAQGSTRTTSLMHVKNSMTLIVWGIGMKKMKKS